MKIPYFIGQKEILPPIFKTWMIPVKLLELGIQFLIIGVNRTFLAQLPIAKGIGHDFCFSKW